MSPTTSSAPEPGGGPAEAGQPGAVGAARGRSATPTGPSYARGPAVASATTTSAGCSNIIDTGHYSTTTLVAPRMRTLRSLAVNNGPSSSCTATFQVSPSSSASLMRYTVPAVLIP